MRSCSWKAEDCVCPTQADKARCEHAYEEMDGVYERQVIEEPGIARSTVDKPWAIYAEEASPLIDHARKVGLVYLVDVTGGLSWGHAVLDAELKRGIASPATLGPYQHWPTRHLMAQYATQEEAARAIFRGVQAWGRHGAGIQAARDTLHALVRARQDEFLEALKG